MITAITTIFTLFTSGAGGGLLGGIFGLFKKNQDIKEKLALAQVDLDRDKLDYDNAQKERAHELVMLDKRSQLHQQGVKLQGDIELEKLNAEGDIEVELGTLKSLSEAQKTIGKLNTTSGMDNYRASVRPTLAYWFTLIFTAMLAWAFFTFSELINPSEGKEILLGMFGTLTFMLTSLGTFYFISRPNIGK